MSTESAVMAIWIDLKSLIQRAGDLAQDEADSAEAEQGLKIDYVDGFPMDDVRMNLIDALSVIEENYTTEGVLL